MISRIYILAGAALVALAAPAHALQAAPADAGNQASDKAAAVAAALATALDGVCKKQQCPGATAAVIMPDNRVVDVATGLADLERRKPMQPRSRLFGGSTGKTMVALVALSLAEEGKIDLDAPITRYLGDASWVKNIDRPERITTRLLLQHRSGLVNYWDNGAFFRYAADKNFAVMDAKLARSYILKWSTSQPLLSEPGTKFRYSDVGYLVVGEIIEAVTRNGLYTEINKRVVERLGLTDTSPSSRSLQKNQAMGYIDEFNPLAPEGPAARRTGNFTFNPEIEYAGGGYVTTSADLAKLFKGIFDGKVVSQDSVRQMIGRAPSVTDEEANSPGGYYGLAMHVVRDYRGLGTAYFHSGYLPGYQTMVYYIPSLQAAVAYQTNSEAGLWATAMRRPLKAPLSDHQAAIADLITAIEPILRPAR